MANVSLTEVLVVAGFWVVTFAATIALTFWVARREYPEWFSKD